jgi:hypothetical protein
MFLMDLLVPAKFADFELVTLHKNTPHCKLHGAMNKMNTLEHGGGYWRCISTVSKTTENCCRAGCIEIKTK